MAEGVERKSRSYRDLRVWQRAMDLVILVYAASRAWPREELYGLTRQAREAAVSIPANIAEGQGRNSSREFVQFLGVANGSLMELETELLIAQRLDYSSPEALREIFETAAEVGRLLFRLKAALKTEN